MISASATLAQLRSSTAALLTGLEAERWTDADMRLPSLLPDWSRGHVLTHIARNADGIASTVAGALRGEIVARYPGGQPQRDADIRAGADRSALELLGDVRDSAERLDRVLAAAALADAWEAECDTRTVGEYVEARWREVELHRVDLAGSYTAADWPPQLISYLVPLLIASLDERTAEGLLIEVTASDSVTTDLPGTSWAVAGSGARVSGPDWALAAWLVGRPEAAGSALSATPELSAWM